MLLPGTDLEERKQDTKKPSQSFHDHPQHEFGVAAEKDKGLGIGMGGGWRVFCGRKEASVAKRPNDKFEVKGGGDRGVQG